MKNFSKYIDKKIVSDIIKAHDMGILGNAIDSDLLNEFESIEPDFLSNLNCSEEAKLFIDQFLSDVDNFQQNGEGSVYAEEFVSLNR